jgi:thiol-disulfide isomerase/thioredoxin
MRLRLLLRRSRVLLLPLLALVLACCPAPTDDAPRSAESPPTDPGDLFAVLINGGDRREANYRSHLGHIEQLLRLLDAARVDPAHIAVFASDGPDPTPDLATRETQSEPDFWLLPPSGVANYLRPPMRYVDSAIDGFSLRPASRDAIGAWFREEGSRLISGDTLLFYVTDHGKKNAEDPTNNTISLWGEPLSVAELQDLLAFLDPQVRIVMLMSQCYSGSFANAIFAADSKEAPLGKVCGYFSTTADRPAFGCYPEDRGREGIGHSHRLFDALTRVGNLPGAHRRALVNDQTPDAPNRSSDFYLEQLLEKEAQDSGRELPAVVDELLREAWRDRALWEPELRLLDRIAHSFGLFSPRSLAELDAEAEGLPELSDRLDTYAERWETALEAAKRENWNRFLAAHPELRPRFQTQALRELGPDERSETTAELLAALLPFTSEDRDTYQKLLSLKHKTDAAQEAHYRAEVRLGAVLRMRTFLTSVAGRVFVERHAEPLERESFAKLSRCEDLAFAGELTAIAESTDPPSPFPPLADDRRLIESVVPSWMGIRYQPVRSEQRRKLELPSGAARITAVFPDSPAEAADLRVSDIIVGQPDSPFEEPHSVREWIMLADLGRPTSLEILRGGEPYQVTLVPRSYPLELPKLPGPPEVGSAAPPLKLDLFRGRASLTAARPRLLFFWATWCPYCSQSLPELIAFAEERDIEIVAISDEPPEVLDAFLSEFDDPFPYLVATDSHRISFQDYGVSATPTFVLVDRKGIVRHYQRGYRPETGLRIEGWEWRRSTSTR